MLFYDDAMIKHGNKFDILRASLKIYVIEHDKKLFKITDNARFNDQMKFYKIIPLIRFDSHEMHENMFPILFSRIF